MANVPSEACEDADPLLDAAAPFGVSYLFPYQRLVISNVLEAVGLNVPNQETWGAESGARTFRDEPEIDTISRQIVVLPTGAGKTLCFQLPARLLPGLTVVIYPLLSLMADQVRRAEAAGLGVAILRGGQSPNERLMIWERVAAGKVQIVLTNPEMLGQDAVLNELTARSVSHVVVDEAHCVSEWGETFRPSYLELGRVITAIKPHVTTAFTATASPPVLQAVRTHLFGDTGAHLVQAVPDRPNISYSVLETSAKLFALRQLLAGNTAALQREWIISRDSDFD